ncbi:hypothetical protein BFW01_g5174 [Lasiodiplodia theobromae]|nr:hypothetical protein BFW01_g5174 [Lasiodiplodia theobromae]
MAYTSWKPDAVVAIDFGMTFTEWTKPITIQQWPGKLSAELTNKVQTAIAFDRRTGASLGWGFQCEEIRNNGKHTRDVQIEEYFKLHIDPDYQDGHESAPSSHDAQTWFWHYMRRMYIFIQDYFDGRVARWKQCKVEFVFSVPTTWKNPAMIAHVKRILKEAGFSESHNQRVNISLTEAEAAAVYAASQHYKRDDVILVCDAGGGTTDVNVLKITSDAPRTELTPLSYVEGMAVGSALIDWKMSIIIQQRLELVKHHLQGKPQEIAEQMIRGRFESFKCDFGSEASEMDEIPLPIPGMEPGHDFPGSRIRNSRMIILKEELQHLFDEQIEKILRIIDRQLEKLQHTHSQEVSYIIVSGGLGSSPYLRRRLRDRYQLEAEHLFDNVDDLQILLAPEPQLAVCHGLVMNRVQEITSEIPMYTSRRCRASYGILCREKYDPRRHAGEDVSVDEYDKKKWVDGQIHWVVKKGDPIDVSRGIRHPYRLKRPAGTELKPWRTQIVMSLLPPANLPRSFKQDQQQQRSKRDSRRASLSSNGVTKLCTIESTLMHADMVLHNTARWYHRLFCLGGADREYWLAEFQMYILIEPADLKFELVSRNGEKLAKRGQEGGGGVAVKWEALPQMRVGGGYGWLYVAE